MTTETLEQTDKTISPAQYKDLLGKYESLLEDVKSLKGGAPTRALSKADRVKNHIATVMFFSDKPIVLFDDIKSEEFLDKDGELQMKTSNKIGIHYMEGEKIEHKDVIYRSLMENARRYRAEILKRDKTSITVPQGILPQEIWTSTADPVGLRESNKTFHSEKIVLEQVLSKTVVTVKFLEGPLKDQTITMDANSLNR